MPSRWDRILDQKPIPIAEHLIGELARLLGQELNQWPLPVEDLAVALEPSFAPLLRADSKRPSPTVFLEALRLVRWELERELEAFDEYVRNRRYLGAGLTEGDRPALLFIQRFVLEQLLGLLDATSGRLKRPQLVRIVEQLEAQRRSLPSA